jgi:hypothetical protein
VLQDGSGAGVVGPVSVMLRSEGTLSLCVSVPELHKMQRGAAAGQGAAVSTDTLAARRGRLAIDTVAVELVAAVARDVMVLRQAGS